MPVTGQDAYEVIRRLFGLPDNDVVQCTIRLRVGEAATVEIESFINTNKNDDTIVQKYELREIKNEQITDERPDPRV